MSIGVGATAAGPRSADKSDKVRFYVDQNGHCKARRHRRGRHPDGGRRGSRGGADGHRKPGLRQRCERQGSGSAATDQIYQGSRPRDPAASASADCRADNRMPAAARWRDRGNRYAAGRRGRSLFRRRGLRPDRSTGLCASPASAFAANPWRRWWRRPGRDWRRAWRLWRRVRRRLLWRVLRRWRFVIR